jgi:hypothetical protein
MIAVCPSRCIRLIWPGDDAVRRVTTDFENAPIAPKLKALPRDGNVVTA